MDAIETLTHNGYVITIHRDVDPVNPRRDYDHLGTLYAESRRYDSRDKNSSPWYPDTDDGISIPVSYSDYDGTLTECEVGSEDGYIYVTREKILREYSCKRISAKVRQTVIRCMEAELNEYNAWVTGDVYGYVVHDESGNDIDSCWGFYGMDYCIESAKLSQLEERKMRDNTQPGRKPQGDRQMKNAAQINVAEIAKRIKEIEAEQRALVGSDEGTHGTSENHRIYEEITGERYATYSFAGSAPSRCTEQSAIDDTRGTIRKFDGEQARIRGLQSELKRLRKQLSDAK